MCSDVVKSDRVSTIKVCVGMIVYNQEPFIEEAIKGVLMQEADFEIQLVIGEDCGTDNSRKICERYAKQYPEKINLLESTRNLGIQDNVFRTIEACLDATYIAFCEGDDVWIDRNKLRHQVELLENNKNYQAHAHNVIRRDLTVMEDSDFGERTDRELVAKDLFLGWPFHVVSLMVRAELLRSIPVNKLPRFNACDRFLNMWIVCHGTMYYEGAQFLAVYHRHQSGESGNANWVKVRQQDLAMLSFFRAYLNDERLYREARLHAIKHLFFLAAKLDSPITLQKWPLFLEFIRFASYTEASNVWFLLLIIFGRPYYRFYEALKNSVKSILGTSRKVPQD